MIEIPELLIDNIKNKNVVLFLGSGFAYNAKHPKSNMAPLGKQLGELISDKFLDGKYKDSALTYISDLAISESSLFDFQNFIADLFNDFTPNENHELYATLPWKAIFTTNYDLIVERSYQARKKTAIQDLRSVYRNTPEPQNIQDSEYSPLL